MSTALYRLGRFAARRHWLVIGSWFFLAAAVVVANSMTRKTYHLSPFAISNTIATILFNNIMCM